MRKQQSPRLANPLREPRKDSRQRQRSLLAGIQASDLQYDVELPLLVNQQTARLLQLIAASDLTFN